MDQLYMRECKFFAILLETPGNSNNTCLCIGRQLGANAACDEVLYGCAELYKPALNEMDDANGRDTFFIPFFTVFRGAFIVYGTGNLFVDPALCTCTAIAEYVERETLALRSLFGGERILEC